jgi:hypothetical protein
MLQKAHPCNHTNRNRERQMTYAKEREQFIAHFCAEFPNRIEEARLLLRHAKTHTRIQEMVCNGHPACSSPTLPQETISRLQERHEQWCEKREQQIERRIAQICKDVGVAVEFGGDPRGYTVKLHLPSGRCKESGYGVPS